MWEEKIERENANRLRIERLLQTRENERIINNHRLIEHEEQVAKMEKSRREKERRNMEDMKRAESEMEHLRQALAVKLAAVSLRNVQREELAKKRTQVYNEIAQEEQQRLAKIRGIMAKERVKKSYRCSTRGVRNLQNNRRVQVRRLESCRERETAKSFKLISEEGKRSRSMGKENCKGVTCRKSTMHVMECPCCQPPKSWGLKKMLPVAWEITGIGTKDSGQQTSIRSHMKHAKYDKHEEQTYNAKNQSISTRNMMRKDKENAVRCQAPANAKKYKRDPKFGAQHETEQEKQEDSQCKQTRRGRKEETRKMIRRDKLQKRHKKPQLSSELHRSRSRQVAILIENQQEKGNEPTEVNEVCSIANDLVTNDDLENIVKEFIAASGAQDLELKRLIEERKQIMAST